MEQIFFSNQIIVIINFNNKIRIIIKTIIICRLQSIVKIRIKTYFRMQATITTIWIKAITFNLWIYLTIQIIIIIIMAATIINNKWAIIIITITTITIIITVAIIIICKQDLLKTIVAIIIILINQLKDPCERNMIDLL